MLSITVPSGENTFLTFQLFEDFSIPAPPAGADAELSNALVLKFEDEEEAVIYAEQLENMANDIDDKSTPQYQAVNDIIAAIWNDEFVQSYSKQ